MKTYYINGVIHTMNGKEIVEAMVVENDKIIALGNNEEILKNTNENDSIIDLENNTVIPGFNDSHLHGLLTAQKMSQIDVTQTKSIDDLIKKSKEQLPKDIKDGEWIIGRGWLHDNFKENRFPTKDDLDKITTEYPLVLIRACIHICVVNSKALELINLDKNNLPIIEDGEIYTDENGELTGLFSESALLYVYNNFPKKSREEIKEMILKLQKHLNSYGITSIQSDDFTALNNTDYHEVIEAYKELAKEDKLTLKVYQQCLLNTPQKFIDFLDEGYKTKQDFGFYRIGPLKLLLDGSLGARTAVIEGGYADDSEANGISIYSDDTLYEYGKIAAQNNIQLAVHGIGDGATNQIIRLCKKINQNFGYGDYRHGIVHCQISTKPILDEIVKEKIVVYAQPIFLDYDIHIVENRVGKEKARTSYAFKTLLDDGASVSLGTDSPVDAISPFKNMYCAITRKDLSLTMDKGWFEQECLSIEEAVKAYTYESAYQSFEEDIKGTLEKGKVADFIVLDQNIFEVTPEKMLETQVLKTIVNGKLVYSK